MYLLAVLLLLAQQLLRALLEFNPLGGVISAAGFAAHAAQCDAWLAAHAPDVLARLVAPAAAAAAAGATAGGRLAVRIR
jgi:hypothetical protein